MGALVLPFTRDREERRLALLAAQDPQNHPEALTPENEDFWDIVDLVVLYGPEKVRAAVEEAASLQPEPKDF